jgi:hypothetical protein
MSKNVKAKIGITLGFLVLLEALIIFLSFSSFLPGVSAVVGTPNATVQTFLEVGESFPEIINITVDDFNESITLNANSTKTVSCVARIVDYNDDDSLDTVTAVFYDTVLSTAGGPDDNNTHYTNSSCIFDLDFVEWNGHLDDDYHALGICTFEIWYYANPGNWNCSMTVTDNASLSDTQQDDITIDELLAVGLPDFINYGTVNATYVSDEQIANVSNVGNVELNLSLSGYAQTPGDGLAMNCSLGRNGYIDLDYEKYNLTETTPGSVTLTSFENLYLNLTSAPVVKEFNLPYRQEETYNEAVKSSFWRIYVPQGAAGSCQGNIVFGATVAPGN